jgi:hypothetical protein
VWDDDDLVEVHPPRATARAIAYDVDRNRLREVMVVDADPSQAAHRAIEELYRKVKGWWTVEVTVTR